MTGAGPRSVNRRRAGGPALFVYGTLMDADVRSLVLRRPLDGAQLHPAALKHYRRVYIAGRLYPMILPRRCATVEGLLLSDLGEEDYARLDAFEGVDYRRERQAVWPEDAADGAPLLAWLYRTRGVGARPGLKEWRLDDWRAREKAVFLRAAQAWLAELSAMGRP